MFVCVYVPLLSGYYATKTIKFKNYVEIQAIKGIEIGDESVILLQYSSADITCL